MMLSLPFVISSVRVPACPEPVEGASTNTGVAQLTWMARFVFQASFPVSASTATVCASSVLKMIFPSQYAAPRFTTSQQATPCDARAGLGS